MDAKKIQEHVDSINTQVEIIWVFDSLESKFLSENFRDAEEVDPSISDEQAHNDVCHQPIQ